MKSLKGKIAVVAGSSRGTALWRETMDTMSAYWLTSVHAARIRTKHVQKAGQLLWASDLAKEYGFTGVDGRYIPRFDPKAPTQAFPC